MYQYIHKNFNSIKVQLRQIRRRERMTKNRFQFHKGTIKTKAKKGNFCEHEISIP